jgi:uncharacterized protein
VTAIKPWSPTKEEIIQRILTKRKNLASLGLASTGLTGSFARGEQTRSSDIDILVEFEPEKHTFNHFMEPPFQKHEICLVGQTPCKTR